MNGMQRMNPVDRPEISGKEVKDLVAFGKKCAKGAFPNPTRAGCPDRARLRAMARRDPNLTLADLPITHVVRCSPCFEDYLQFRRMSLFVRGLQITAASLIVAGIFVTAVLFVRNRTRDTGQPSLSQQKQLSPEPSPGHVTSQPGVRVPLQVKVDLEAFSPTRGEEKESRRRAIHLPRQNLRITFQMPLGLEPGEYVIELKGPAGTVYFHGHAPGHLFDGTTSVEVDVDLTRMPRGSVTLMVGPPGLSWRIFPAVLE